MCGLGRESEVNFGEFTPHSELRVSGLIIQDCGKCSEIYLVFIGRPYLLMVWMSMFCLNDQILFGRLVTCLDILILCLWCIFLLFFEECLGRALWMKITCCSSPSVALLSIVHPCSRHTCLVCVCVFLFIYLLFFMWHILINC